MSFPLLTAMSRQCIAGNGEGSWPPLSQVCCLSDRTNMRDKHALHRDDDDEVWGKGWDNATPKITEISKTTNKCSFWLHDTPPHSLLPFYQTPWHVCHSIEKGWNLKLQKIRLQQSCGLLCPTLGRLRVELEGLFSTFRNICSTLWSFQFPCGTTLCTKLPVWFNVCRKDTVCNEQLNTPLPNSTYILPF